LACSNASFGSTRFGWVVAESGCFGFTPISSTGDDTAVVVAMVVNAVTIFGFGSWGCSDFFRYTFVRILV
jgi:hypothetical protein